MQSVLSPPPKLSTRNFFCYVYIYIYISYIKLKWKTHKLIHAFISYPNPITQGKHEVMANTQTARLVASQWTHENKLLKI